MIKHYTYLGPPPPPRPLRGPRERGVDEGPSPSLRREGPAGPSCDDEGRDLRVGPGDGPGGRPAHATVPHLRPARGRGRDAGRGGPEREGRSAYMRPVIA